MHGFSTADGFVEITEGLAEMIKYLANEPSVGLFYVQQHTQNAVPNLINLKNNVVEKSHETALHTEDLEDSIIMVNSMKECGLPIADEMIRDIKKALAIMSTKQPRRGLIRSPYSNFQAGRTSSWGPATWGRSSVFAQQEGERSDGYFSTVIKSAKQKASNFKWPQLDPKELGQTRGKKQDSFPSVPPLVVAASTGSTIPDTEVDELPVSSHTADDLPGEPAPLDGNSPSHNLLSASENYDVFRADRAAKLEEWLEGVDNPDNFGEANGK